jgi:hypothetical protein
MAKRGNPKWSWERVTAWELEKKKKEKKKKKKEATDQSRPFGFSGMVITQNYSK